jgi:hypothetical protein
MFIERQCDFCKKTYQADSRNLKRGWGLCCSKSCAAKNKPKHLRQKPKYKSDEYDDWHIFSDDAFNY